MPDIDQAAAKDVAAAVDAVGFKVRDVARKAPEWARQVIIDACIQDSTRLYSQAVARHRARVHELPSGVAGSVAQLTMSLASSLAILPWHLVKTTEDQERVVRAIAQGGGSSNPMAALIEEWDPMRVFFVAGPGESLSAYLARVTRIVRAERVEHVVLDGAIKPGVQGRTELARNVEAPLFYVHEALRSEALKLSLMRGNGVEYDWNSRPAPGPGVPPPMDIKRRIESLRAT